MTEYGALNAIKAVACIFIFGGVLLVLEIMRVIKHKRRI